MTSLVAPMHIRGVSPARAHAGKMAEELVPTLDFRYKDLVSSGLGTLLGMCWVYLYDSLLGAQA